MKVEELKKAIGEEILTQEEARKFLGLGYHAFIQEVKSGSLPYFTIGKRRFFVKEELVKTLKERMKSVKA